MTFKERYLRGDCPVDVLNDWVEVWKTNGFDYKLLPAVLGLTEDEYRLWAIAGNDALTKQLAGVAKPHYTALYLDWDELHDQLQELVHLLIGEKYAVSVHLPYGVDEKDCEKICELLELEETDADELFWSGDIGNNQLNGLLSKLTHRKVIFNHANDYGIWVICKDGRVPVKSVENGG